MGAKSVDDAIVEHFQHNSGLSAESKDGKRALNSHVKASVATTLVEAVDAASLVMRRHEPKRGRKQSQCNKLAQEGVADLIQVIVGLGQDLRAQ